jgi:hypothetical protein
MELVLLHQTYGKAGVVVADIDTSLATGKLAKRFKPELYTENKFAKQQIHQMIQLTPFTEKDFDQLIAWVDSNELLMTIAGPYFSFRLQQNNYQIFA